MKSFFQNNSQRFKSDGILLLAAVIWGMGFVAQRAASYHLGFFAFNSIRFLLGGLVMLPFVIGRVTKKPGKLIWIFPAGLLLFSGSALQQAGIETSSAGTAGFITGTYVVLVPIMLLIFWKQPQRPVIWIAALVALLGTYLLSTGGTRLAPSSGNLILLVGSLVWAFHVIVVGLASRQVDVLVFSVGQFLFCGLLNLLFSLFVDLPSIEAVQRSYIPILYGGLGSVALGFTLQAIGQRKAPTADATLILSLESVFAAIFGALILAEKMTLIQIFGCAIIFAAILFAQLPSLKIKQKNANS